MLKIVSRLGLQCPEKTLRASRVNVSYKSHQIQAKEEMQGTQCSPVLQFHKRRQLSREHVAAHCLSSEMSTPVISSL